MASDDERLVGAMSHEYQLLLQSYKEFLFLIVMNKQSHNDEVKFHMYNCYARVILHLYEFLKACVAREFSKTKSEDNTVVKNYIIVEISKLARQRGEQYDPSKIDSFAEDLRKYRNKVYGHVLKERLDQYPLGEFYSKYHVYIVWFIHGTEYWWKSEASELAKHKSIQDFSELLTFGQRVG